MLFCCTARSPPLAPVIMPPLITWVVLDTDGATMMVPSTPRVWPGLTVTVVDLGTV